MFGVLILLQASSVVEGEALPSLSSSDVLERAAKRPPGCPNGADGEIVVCARPDEGPRFRLEPLPPVNEPDEGLRFLLPGDVVVTPRVGVGPRWGDPRVTVDVTVPF